MKDNDELEQCPDCGNRDCVCPDYPDQCHWCMQVIDNYKPMMRITVDLDPGDCEVGPDPNIVDVLVHVECHEDRTGVYRGPWCQKLGGENGNCSRRRGHDGFCVN